jgi:hypothetical protein
VLTILGLDVSTSVVGVSLVTQPDVPGALPIINMLEHIDFKDCEDVWDKCDKFRDVVKSWMDEGKLFDVTHVFVEDAALMFSMGKSSAGTLATLIRFNGLCSYAAYSLLNIRPEFISVAHARKLCGMKIQRKSKCGVSAKEQAFKYMREHDLSHVTWELKKKTKKNPEDRFVDYAYDINDAYVVAKAGLLSVDVRDERAPSLL